MKTVMLLCIVFITAILVSCANMPFSNNGAEFQNGRLFATEYAKQDALKFNCNWYPSRVYAAFGSRKYTAMLRDQGRSQHFIDGFYYGYELDYNDYLSVYCGA